MSERTVTWTRDKFVKLCDAYKANKHSKSFTIKVAPEGELTFVPDYAKYLIDYLGNEFDRPDRERQPDNEGEESYTPGSGSWEGEGRKL